MLKIHKRRHHIKITKTMITLLHFARATELVLEPRSYISKTAQAHPAGARGARAADAVALALGRKLFHHVLGKKDLHGNVTHRHI